MHSMEEQGHWEWARVDSNLVNPATVKPRMELDTYPRDLTLNLRIGEHWRQRVLNSGVSQDWADNVIGCAAQMLLFNER